MALLTLPNLQHLEGELPSSSKTAGRAVEIKVYIRVVKGNGEECFKITGVGRGVKPQAPGCKKISSYER